LGIVPNVNLISNIGFGPGATNTTDASSVLSEIPVEAMAFPLRHPLFVVQDARAERFIETSIVPPLQARAKTNVKKLLVGARQVDESPGLERCLKERFMEIAKKLKMGGG